MITQETGHALLKAQWIALIAADSPDAFLDDTPTDFVEHAPALVVNASQRGCCVTRATMTTGAS